MASGLIELIKRASLDAMGNAQMCDLRYGKVISISPLKVQITNQLTIPSSLLVVPQHLTDYTVNCIIPQSSMSDTTDVNTEQTSLSTITIHNALKVGDKVALLRKQGGQSYFILDRI